MDIDELINIGIICDTQKNIKIQNDIITLIKDNKFIFLKNKNFYRLKHIDTNKFLFAFDNKIELVEYNKEDFFMKYSKFNILSDNICCSIFPFELTKTVICLEENKLILKNIYLCLGNDTHTIFKLSKLEKPKLINNILKFPKKKLIKANGLDELFLKKKNFTIITNNNNFNNKKLTRFIYYKNMNHNELYLTYIINNYENLKDYSIFFPKVKELDKFIMNLGSNTVITDIDHIITLDGYRYKYRINNTYSLWQNTVEIIDLRDFFRKILRKLPPKKYAEYCSYFFYIVPKKNILQNKITFYQNLKKKIKDKTINLNILEKCWYHIFT